MDSGNDFSRDEIVAYLQERSDQRTLNRINEFKEKDSSYQSLFELLDYTKQELNLSDDLFDQEYTQLGISEKDDFLMRLFSGNLQPDDNYLFLNELNHSSSKLYDDLVGDLKSSTIVPRIPFWERVPWLARVFSQPSVPSKDKVLETITSGQRHLSQTSEDTEEQGLVRIPSFSNFRFKPAVGLSYAFVILLVCGGGIWGGLSYYNTSYKINRAESLLNMNYKIFIENTPRLSGRYPSTGVGPEMGGVAQTSDYLSQASELLHTAIRNGSESPKMKHLLSQVSLIASMSPEVVLPAKAVRVDSILDLLSKTQPKSPEILNDLGVSEFIKKNWQQAESFFRAATTVDSTYAEAYYNLALIQIESGLRNDAILTIEKFLTFETEKEWQLAAEALELTLNNERKN